MAGVRPPPELADADTAVDSGAVKKFLTLCQKDGFCAYYGIHHGFPPTLALSPTPLFS